VTYCSQSIGDRQASFGAYENLAQCLEMRICSEDADRTNLFFLP